MWLINCSTASGGREGRFTRAIFVAKPRTYDELIEYYCNYTQRDVVANQKRPSATIKTQFILFMTPPKCHTLEYTRPGIRINRKTVALCAAAAAPAPTTHKSPEAPRRDADRPSERLRASTRRAETRREPI